MRGSGAAGWETTKKSRTQASWTACCVPKRPSGGNALERSLSSIGNHYRLADLDGHEQAEKQRRWRERRAAGTPAVRCVKAAEPKRSRPERWRAAVATLRELQESYQTWRDNLPESLEDSATAELLDAVIAVDLDHLDIELPKGFGRD